MLCFDYYWDGLRRRRRRRSREFQRKNIRTTTTTEQQQQRRRAGRDERKRRERMRTVVAKTGFRAGKTEFFVTTTTPRRSSLVLFFLSSVSSSDVSRRSSSSSATTTTGKEDIGYYTGKKRNPLTDTRLHQYDKRPPPNALCEKCSRRFCACPESKSKTKPEMPGPEDCCQSSPQCKFCVWTIYDEQLTEYETNKELYMDKLK